MQHIPSSDPAFKVMYQDSGLLEDTVRLVAPHLADAYDFKAAVALDKEHLAATNRTRLQDKAYLVEPKDPSRPRLLVVLEFQSGQDANMALRMEEYAYLAATSAPPDTRKGAAAGRLPEVLPLVIYNGEHPWRASTEGVVRRIGDGPPMRGQRMIRWTCLGWRTRRTSSDGDRAPAIAWRRWRVWKWHRLSVCRRSWRKRSGVMRARSRRCCGDGCTARSGDAAAPRRGRRPAATGRVRAAARGAKRSDDEDDDGRAVRALARRKRG